MAADTDYVLLTYRLGAILYTDSTLYGRNDIGASGERRLSVAACQGS